MNCKECGSYDYCDCESTKALRAEVERLTKERDEARTLFKTVLERAELTEVERDKLKRSNERLQDALRRIYATADTSPAIADALDSIRDGVRAVLAGKEQS